MVQGKNDYWEVTVTPSGPGDISIALGPTTDCSATGAMCTGTGDNRVAALERSELQPSQGPPQLSIADATVEEAANATVDFEVVDVQSSFGHRDSGVRNIGRKCTRRVGLHRGLGNADVRRQES